MVAESVGRPQRLDNLPGSAVYEQTVEVTLPQAGRYALRVEGTVPASIRPAGVPTIPAIEKSWEMRPRVFIDTLSGAGRVVLADFATAEGGLGTPADARSAITVGAADASGKPLPSSASGSAPGDGIAGQASGAGAGGQSDGGAGVAVEPVGRVCRWAGRQCDERRSADGEVPADDGDGARRSATCAGGLPKRK